jgi:hypothetical protein
MIDAVLERLIGVADVLAEFAERYAAQADWDPRSEGATYAYLVLRPEPLRIEPVKFLHSGVSAPESEHAQPDGRSGGLAYAVQVPDVVQAPSRWDSPSASSSCSASARYWVRSPSWCRSFR